MTGQELKEVLREKEVMLNDLAAKMELSQPALSQMFRTQDVKSGTLEKICDIMSSDINYFYKDTKYDPLLNRKGRTLKVDKTVSLHKDNELQSKYNELEKKHLVLQGKYEALEKAYEILVKSKMGSSGKAVGE